MKSPEDPRNPNWSQNRFALNLVNALYVVRSLFVKRSKRFLDQFPGVGVETLSGPIEHYLLFNTI